jgi:ATP-binding cassette, subfamily F, member 3
MLYRFENVEKSYGIHDILKGTTWQHNPSERVGLVGRNGAGKTTLFKILLGTEEIDRGAVYRANGLTVGHLSQHLDAEPGASLFDFVLAAFREVLALEKKMRDLEHQMAEAGVQEQERLLEKYADVQHDYEHANGYTIHSEVERVLTGVGFDKGDWDREIRTFSGGQQNRAMLSRLLLSQVDLLLLDEPTNHLDLRGIEFLEQFLQSYKGSYLLISHDRTFLNRTVTKIVELAHGKLIEYHGNYDKFVEQRAERHELMRAEFERQQAFIERTEDFIRRNIAGQKTKQAQSRRKMLAKIDEVERPETDETLARFQLDAGARSSAIALTTESLAVGYGQKVVVSDLFLSIRRGERYAIMGPNGSGKSTILKTLAGRLEPLEGRVLLGNNVQVGYYDQTLGDLRQSGRVLDEIWDLDHAQTEEDVRSYLARFSFTQDDVTKKVATLSGGEKGRLALAKIMFNGGNLLLLDEPTNHLDVYTREALEEAIEKFTGALIVVSHDRYFVDRVAQNILLVEEGEAEVHHLTYSELMDRFKREESAVAQAKQTAKPLQQKPEEFSREEQKNRQRRLRKIGEELEAMQKKIDALEAKTKQNQELLCDEEIYRDGPRVRQIQLEDAEARAELEKLYSRWEELEAQRESLAAVPV